MRNVRRFVVIAAVAATATLTLTAPAAAHVTVSADNPRAGAENVTLTFAAKAESESAGIASLRVSLPKGITARDVKLADAPTGWTLRARGNGYEVSGPALNVGEDATHSVKVARLPTGESRVLFPTVQLYANGRVDNWVNVAPHEGTKHNSTDGVENPSPVLEVAPAGAPAGGGASAGGQGGQTGITPAAGSGLVTVGNSGSDNSTTVRVGLIVVVLLAAGAVVVLLLRRRPTQARYR